MHQHREESKEVMKPKEKKDESLLNPILKLESDSNESEESVRPVKTLTEIQQRLICEICGLRNFESVKEMNTHSKTHSSQNTSFVCKYCPSNNPMSFPRKIQLRIHERKVHEKHFIKQSKIESEIVSSLEVTKEKEHQLCEVCNYECISKSALEKHILTHTKERPHECPECRKRFVQTSQVNYHIKTVHAPPGTLRLKHHSCLECGAKFSTASTLRKHYRTHTGM
jgi:KRAB domain-containing zinc finger protein